MTAVSTVPTQERPLLFIKLGVTGPEVVDVQRRLERMGSDGLRIDGEFGERTLQAVRRFQRERGLPADGIVGPETWRNLVEAGHRLGDRLLWRSRRMLRGDDVRDLQHRLNQLGFDAGAEDGIFGPLAHAAVEEFQRNIELPADGVVGPATVAALRRLHRRHQSGGVGARAREREALRALQARGLTGARLMIDPAHGPANPGSEGPGGQQEHALTWALGTRLVARLRALGAEAVPSRGPATSPSASERARLANEFGVDVVLSIALNAWHNPAARGCAISYYGNSQFVSASGEELALHLQAGLVAAGWGPDCRIHPVTWAIVRETRMPAVVIEPAFLTAPQDARRLADPVEQDRLAAVLTTGMAHFFDAQQACPSPVPEIAS